MISLKRGVVGEDSKVAKTEGFSIVWRAVLRSIGSYVGTGRRARAAGGGGSEASFFTKSGFGINASSRTWLMLRL